MDVKAIGRLMDHKLDTALGRRAVLRLLRPAVLLALLVCSACGPTLATSAPPASPPTPTTPPSVDTEEPSAATEAPAATEEAAPPGSDVPLAALINGQPLRLADYERELGQYEADMPLRGIDPGSEEGQADLAQARAWILDWLITEILIVQAAEDAGGTVSDAEVDAILEEMIAENGGEEAFLAKLVERGETREDARAQVRTGLIVSKMNQQISEGVPSVAEHVHARHILVDTAEEAERIHAQLDGGADFSALAKQFSQDPNTRETGGDLGFFPRGILTAPEVEEAAFALQPGQYSDVVASLLGYHIVQVVERDPTRDVNPDNLRLLQEQVLQAWVEGLKAQATVEIFVDVSP